MGNIKRLCDLIIEQKSKGNAALVPLTKAKLIMKGIDPDKYTSATPDDPVVLAKLNSLASELGLQVA
jgi:hypothetical protein